MGQPSKRSLSARRTTLLSPASNGSDRKYARFIVFKLGLVLLVGLILALVAGLALDLNHLGINRRPATHSSAPQLQSLTRSTTASRKMESIRVSKKQTRPPKDISNPMTAQTPTDGSFTLVSINVAGCVPSKMAPESWTENNSIDAVRAEIISHRPDWIALQESPGGVELVDQVFGPEGYKAVGATYSHADQVVVLVKKEIKANLIPMPGLPVIMAELELGSETGIPHRLMLASVHLEPFAQGNHRRAQQMEAIVEEAKSRSLAVVIAGDTNMRPTEDMVMEDDFQLLDVWKLAGSNPSTQFTWDTMDHRTDAAGRGKGGDKKDGYFNQYYGQSTRQYTARYDRIYVHHANHSIDVLATTDNCSPVTFDLIANRPMTSKLDFLSDHFGVVSKLPIQWK